MCKSVSILDVTYTAAVVRREGRGWAVVVLV